MAICPFAHADLYAGDARGRSHRPIRMTLHTAAPGPARGPLYRGAPAANGTYAHFYIDSRGELYQTRDTGLMARADGSGNHGSISLETWDGNLGGPLNAAQFATAARLFAWLRSVHPTIPNRVATVDNLTGLAWHRLGVRGNFGRYNPADLTTWSAAQTGQRWSTSYGKLCPTNPKIRQIPALWQASQHVNKPQTERSARMRPDFIIFNYGGGICLANVSARTWEALPNPQTYQDTVTMLNRAGYIVTQYKDMPGRSPRATNDVTNPAAFGKRV